MGKTYTNKMPVPREFDCRYCGEHVVVSDRHDHRSVYCCARCEKEYWRKKSKNQLRKQIGKGHVTYLSREQSENRREAGF